MIRRFTLLGVARLIAAAVQAVLLIIVARLVEVAVFGELSVALAVLTFVFLVAGAGLPQFILRERALANAAAVRAGLNVNVASTAIGVALLAAVTLGFAPHSLVVPALLLVLAVALDKTVDCQLAVPIADKRVPVAVTSIVGRAVVMAATFVVALVVESWLGGDAIMAFVAARLAAGLFGVVHVLVSVRAPHHVVPLSLGELARVLWPLATANLIGAIRSLDSLFVYVAAGSATAGLYSAASRPFAPASILSGAAGSVLMPQAATASIDVLRAGVLRLRLLTVLSTLALAPFAFLGPFVTELIYGVGYAGAGAALGIVLLSVPAVVAASLIATVLQSRGRERFVVANGVLFLSILILAVGLGAYFGGVTGAAIGLTASSWGRTTGLNFGARSLGTENGADRD